jgi:eukaryotic-like serine/threonine-protein kinase
MGPGEVIAGRFVVEARAGAGGMATVYRARDQIGGATVAVKVLDHVDDLGEERFGREARVLAELSHPGLVRYVAHGTTERGGRYLAMEWLDGCDLAARLGRGPLDVATAIGVVRRAADALAAAHARGIIHRDIKPSNLFLVDDRPDRVKVVDFGLARTVLGPSATRTGSAIGTPRFMAPEQVRGLRDLDARVDVYGLGGVLFACIAGRPAFRGSDDMAVLAKVLLEDAPRLAELCAGVPDRLDRLVTSMLAKDRDERPRDAALVVGLLDAIAADTAVVGAVAEAPAVAVSGGEQRLLSVVVVDAAARFATGGDVTSATVVTPRSHVAQLAAAHPADLRTVVERHGARLEILPDGTIVATVAGAASATDQTSQAARCALALRSRYPDAAIALATGRGQLAVRRTTGDVLDRAASLLRRARARAPLAIVLDDVTAGLLGGRFDTVDGAAGTELREEREADPLRTLLGRATPCVGRDAEIEMLAALFDQCVSESAARAALVIGGPGVGKSRLRYELGRRLASRGAPYELWIGRGDPLREGAPFGLLAPAIRRAAGALDGEPLPIRRDKLATRVARHVPPAAVARVTEFLGELAGIPFSDDASVPLRTARRDPRLMSEQMRFAWVEFVAAETAAHPVVIVLEDLHWGDWPTAKFVDAALAALGERPLMVLALARPEVKERFPGLWSGRPLLEVALGQLSRRAAERLVRAVLGDGVDASTVERLVGQAAGNALHLEELIRAVAEGKGDALPESVLAMMQARLDRLPADARRVLRAASVFSNLFWASGVAALLGGDEQIADQLGFLVDEEVIARRGDRKFPAEDEYVFRHSLVRDAAYSLLTETDRALGHQAAAAWLEQAGETDAVVLAEHHERGGQPREAAAWYRRAAAEALEAQDLPAAVSRAGRGLACACDADDALRGALYLIEAQAHHWLGQFAEQGTAADAAMARLPRGGGPWCQAAAEAATARGRLGDQDGLVAIGQLLCEVGGGDRAFLLAAASTAAHLLFNGHYAIANALLDLITPAIAACADDDPAVTAAILRVRGVQAICRGDLGDSLAAKRASVDAYERAGDLPSAYLQRGNLGSVYISLGSYGDAEVLLADAAAAADRLGLPSVASLCRSNLGNALSHLGRIDEAIAVQAQAVREFQELRERRMEGLARSDLAAIRCRAGDLDGAAAEARAAIELTGEIPPSRAYALGHLARILLAAGDAAGAHAAAGEAMAILDRLGGLDEGEALVRLVHAEALDAVGDHDAARAAIASARERLDEVAAKIADPAWRASFLTRVEENARTIERADAWARPGG